MKSNNPDVIRLKSLIDHIKLNIKSFRLGDQNCLK